MAEGTHSNKSMETGAEGVSNALCVSLNKSETDLLFSGLLTGGVPKGGADRQVAWLSWGADRLIKHKRFGEISLFT